MKIMIVDDEPKIRKGIKMLLDGQKGFDVVGAYDGAESALMDILEKTPDVIVTDIKMPEYSGLDLIEKIREREKNIYIIIISGYSNFEYAQQAIKYGVYRYLTKPTNPRELIEVLREIERKQEPQLCGSEPPAGMYVNSDVGNLLVRKAVDYIEIHYAEKIGLKSIAEVLYISPNYLSDLFRRHMKENFSDYLIDFRLKKACIYLKMPEYKVSDVSQMTGFRDAAYFSTVFKKAYNMTPLEFKNKAK